MTNTVTLPWPPKELSPNSRGHWVVESRHAKVYRQTCAMLARKAGLTAPDAPGRLHLWIYFYPPDRRVRDDDNMIGAFKSGRDGIADALGINDHEFICHPVIIDEIGGMIKIEIVPGG